ncbi:MAG: tetratricopeptide repeat protein [Planctomycetes bacterium]|nr:tetratricopeptide repeat protein [Planctomycetota bacterium]
MSAALGLALALATLLQQAPGVAPPPVELPAPADPSDWRALWDSGRLESAVDLLEQQLAQHPDDVALRIECARRQMMVHRYAAALASAEPLGEVLRPLRGQALYLLGRHEEALDLLDPDDPVESLMRVDALEMLGRRDETWAALAQAERVRGADDPLLLALEGRLLAGAGKHEEAVAAFRHALEGDPFLPAARFGLGQSLLRLGRREEGLAVLAEHRRLAPLIDRLEGARRAVELGPFHADNHAQLGDVLRELGRLDEADACYSRAIDLATPASLVPVVLRRARLLAEDRHDVDGAVAQLEQGLERGGDVRLAVRAGDVLRDAGRPAEALPWYERALVLRPGDPAIVARAEAVRAAATEGTP